MIWVGLIVLGVLAGAALITPMLTRPRAAARDQALVVYRDQLDDVERQAAAGDITVAEAAAARAEIGRRVLALAPSAAPARTPLSPLVPLTALAVPLIAGILYLQIGVPRYAPASAVAEDPMTSIMRLPPEQRAAAIRAMVENFAARMDQDRDNLDGWRRLGRAWATLGERERARAAFARAVELAPDNVEALADLAGTYSDQLGAGRPLPPPFLDLMRRMLALRDDHADALWFVGLAELQAGNRTRAIELWTRLLALLPADSAEAREIRSQLERARAAN